MKAFSFSLKPDAKCMSACETISESTSILTFLVGCAVVMGWIFDVPALKSVLPGLVTMKFNTALCFVAAGLSLWFSQEKRKGTRFCRPMALAGAAVVLGLGAATFLEYLFHVDLGIDQLFFKELPGAILTPYLGRMAFATSANFAIIGSALILLNINNRQAHFAAQFFTFPGVFFSISAYIGYVYQVQPLYKVSHFSTAMALHTSLLFIAVFLGLLLCRAKHGMMAHFTCAYAGGKLLRWFLPFAILVPFLLGAIKLYLEKQGFISNELGVLLVAMGNLSLVSFYILLIAIFLNRAASEREAALENFEASETNYRALFETAQDGILIVESENGTIIDTNPFLQKMMDSSREELVGKKIWEIDAFKKIVFSRESFLKLKNKGYARYDNFQHRTKGGQLMDLEFISNVYSTGKQKVIQCDIRDITDRKQAERKLLILSSRNEAILASVPDIITETDKKNVYKWMNRAGKKFFGEDAIGKEASSYFAGSHGTSNTIQPILDGHETIRYVESWQRRCDGQKRLLAWWCRAMMNENGRLVGVLSSARDITDQKQAEEKLLELSRAVEQSPATVVITDTQGRIEYVNPKFTELTGYSFDEVRGKNPSLLKSGEQSLDFYQKLWKTITEGREWRGQFHNRKKNGELYWESASISPIVDPEGKTIHFLAVKEDITELKKLEKIKDDFISTVSHEMRTPLTAIAESVRLVEDLSLGTLNESQKKFLHIGRKNIDRLSRFINDVLDFQRFQHGKTELHLTKQNINALCEEVHSNMKALAIIKRSSFDCVLAPDLPDIFVDRTKILQALTNLVSNAIKFGEKKPVKIATAVEGDNAIRVSVMDEGLGIRTEDLDGIFQSFAQVGPIESRTPGSSGLGLAITREIILAHNGKIWVESAAGKGSVFHFVIPIQDLRNRVALPEAERRKKF